MGFVRIVSLKPGGDEYYTGTIGGKNFYQNDLTQYNKGDILSIDIPISEAGADYLRRHPEEDVVIWTIPGCEGEPKPRVVLNFIVTQKVHSLSSPLNTEMGRLDPLCDTIIIAPITDSTETVFRWLQGVDEHPWDDPYVMPF